MKKSAKSKAPAMPKVDPYLEGIVSKLIDRLLILERKVDTVISQTAFRFSSHSEPAKTQVPQPNHQPPQQTQPTRRDRTMYEAICADCSKVCEVPFRPTEARPVYCKDCWGKRKATASQPKHGMPVLTPVTLPSKPASKLNALFAPEAPVASKKVKKSQPAKKVKNKK